MNHYHCPMRGEDEIRAAGKTAIMKSVTEPANMKTASDNQLRASVFPFDPTHIEPTLPWR